MSCTNAHTPPLTVKARWAWWLGTVPRADAPLFWTRQQLEEVTSDMVVSGVSAA